MKNANWWESIYFKLAMGASPLTEMGFIQQRPVYVILLAVALADIPLLIAIRKKKRYSMGPAAKQW